MSSLTVIALVAAALAAVLHVVFFVLESVIFSRRPVQRLFGVRTSDDSSSLRLFARNQGVYNLGLALVVAVAVAVGIVLTVDADAAIGAAVIVAGCAVMVLAALALAWTAPRLWRAALVQGVPPLVASVALLVR